MPLSLHLVLAGTRLVGLCRHPHSDLPGGVPVFALLFSLYEDMVMLGQVLTDLVSLDHLCEDPISKEGHILKYFFGGTPSDP